MVNFTIQLLIDYGQIRGCEALDLTRQLKLQETTYICSMGLDHRLDFKVDEAFARAWFPTLESCRMTIPTKYLTPGDVEMNYVQNQYQIRLNQKMTVERAKELFVAVRTFPSHGSLTVRGSVL